ncbi:MAG: helix-turn-helix transcriptional regulator [Aureibaculum sp.]|nr:helix-turn-helix transcriptional regulator [Aureibaculum sp.]
MKKKNFNITINGYLPSLLTGLSLEGYDTNRFIKNPYLKKMDLFDPNKYIPNVLLEELLVTIKNDLGIDSLSTDLSECFKSTNMGFVSNHIFRSPSFLTFLEEVVKHQKLIKSNYTVKLETTGAISKFSVKVNEALSPGKLICEEIDIMRILDAFMLVGGENYCPIELGVTANSSYYLESVLPKGDYNLKLNQSESWILFNTSLLSQEIPSIFEVPESTILPNSDQITSFEIEQLLNCCNQGTIPHLDELSQMLNVSRRTIERKLQSEGTTFSHLKENLLQRKSFELLSESNLSIKEISEQLDYSQSQNFIRSFRKWTGTSPDEYRLQL